MEREARAVRELAKAYAALRRDAASARREVTELRRELAGNVLTETYQTLRRQITELADAYGRLQEGLAVLESKDVTLRFRWVEEGGPPDLSRLQQVFRVPRLEGL